MLLYQSKMETRKKEGGGVGRKQGKEGGRENNGNNRMRM